MTEEEFKKIEGSVSSRMEYALSFAPYYENLLKQYMILARKAFEEEQQVRAYDSRDKTCDSKGCCYE